jgi:hypothetical protein
MNGQLLVIGQRDGAKALDEDEAIDLFPVKERSLWERIRNTMQQFYECDLPSMACVEDQRVRTSRIKILSRSCNEASSKMQ